MWDADIHGICWLIHVPWIYRIATGIYDMEGRYIICAGKVKLNYTLLYLLHQKCRTSEYFSSVGRQINDAAAVQ